MGAICFTDDPVVEFHRSTNICRISGLEQMKLCSLYNNIYMNHLEIKLFNFIF